MEKFKGKVPVRKIVGEKFLLCVISYATSKSGLTSPVLSIAVSVARTLMNISVRYEERIVLLKSSHTKFHKAY